MSMLPDLIGRLEGATEGSRELEFWIWWYGASTESRKRDPEPPPDDYVRLNLQMDDAPRYTTSLDAAMTLVPEGWTPWDLIARYCTPAQFNATPALALVVACLRAKMSMETDNG